MFTVGTCVHCGHLVDVVIEGRRITVLPHGTCPGRKPRGYLMRKGN